MPPVPQSTEQLLSAANNTALVPIEDVSNQVAQITAAGKVPSAAELAQSAFSVLRAPAIVQSLSPETRFAVEIIGDAASLAVLGAGGDPGQVAIQIGTNLAAKFASAALPHALAAFSGAIGTAVEAAGAIPVLNFAVDIFTMYSNIVEAREAQELARKIREKEDEDRRTKILASPIGTSATGAPVPADIFAFQDYKIPGWGQLWRSLLGDALVRVTEAGLPGEGDYKKLYGPPKYHNVIDSLFQTQTAVTTEEDYERVTSFIRSLDGNAAFGNAFGVPIDGLKNAGLPRERRLLYRLLRQAIEAQWKERANDSDGGVTLWPIYVDLLNQDFEAGRLSNGSVLLYLASRVDHKHEIASFLKPDEPRRILFDRGTDAITTLIRSWKLANEPFYRQDTTEREERIAQVQKLTRAITLMRLGRPVPTELLADIPEEVRKTLGIMTWDPPDLRDPKRWKARRPQPKETSPLVGVAVFTGAGALAAWAYRSLRARRRREQRRSEGEG